MADAPWFEVCFACDGDGYDADGLCIVCSGRCVSPLPAALDRVDLLERERDDARREAHARTSDAVGLHARVARLERVLAVERRDASCAPDGWDWLDGRWYGPAGAEVVRGDRSGGGVGYAWAYGDCVETAGWADHALDAMEAATDAFARWPGGVS